MIPSPPVKSMLWLSVPLTCLLAFTSIVGIFTPGFYGAETLNWQTQSLGQDIVDLFLVLPCLVISSWQAGRGKRAAWLLWGGVMFYLTYTFVIFCFDVHFNRLFFLYCAELGLSCYGSLLFLFECRKETGAFEKSTGIFKLTGIYFIVIACMFYLLWLSEILPSIIRNTTPTLIKDVGLFTNPVHVLDLSLVLPGIFIAGILILRKNILGFMLAPAVLMFFILMDLTICILVLMMYLKGLESSPAIAIVMAALSLFSLIILRLFLIKLWRK